MKFKAFVAATVAVAALSVAAPAAALTLTFRIDVTSSSDGSPLPASFLETWTFSPTFSSTPIYDPGAPPYFPASTTITDRLSGGAVASEGALTDELLTLAGLDGVAPTASSATFRNRRVYDESNVLKTENTEGEFNLTINASTQLGGADTPDDYSDDIYDNRSYSRYLFVAEGNYSPPAMTEAAFIAFLVAQGPLSWNERASHVVGSPYWGGEVTLDESRSYDGWATLVVDSPAPEPAAWALMILGFGVTGTTLRRRRAIAA